MKLQEIRNTYGDKKIAISYYNSEAEGSLITSHIIHPKEVFIKDDLTVWDAKRGNCIINGMQERDKFMVASSIKELEDNVPSHLQIKVTKKKL